MQTECPHRRFCHLDAVRDELSPQAVEATTLKAVGCSRATPALWGNRCRRRAERRRGHQPSSWPGSSASATPAGRIRRSDNARPCRRIMKTSTKARLPPEKSHM